MDKNEVITISDWQKGQVNHPIYGFGLLQNIDVFENKGIAKLRPRTTNVFSPTQLPIAEVYDTYGNTYTMTGETGQGIVYKNGVAITSSLSNTKDIKIYKDYLFIRHSDSLSMYGPLNNSPQYFGGYTGFDNTYDAPMVVGQDDYLYIGNGNYVAKVEVTASGTPTVQPTLTITAQALDLPDGQYVSCLVEYGTKIAIGTHGGVNYYDKNNVPTARIYTWNRQAGTLGNPGLADLPIIFSENGINAILQHANKLYVSAGTAGNIYVTDSTNYRKIITIPYTPSAYGYSSTVFKNAMSISNRGNLLVGISGDYNPVSTPGIYEVELDTEGNPTSYFKPTSLTIGTIGASTVTKIGFIRQKNYQTIKIGWSAGSTYAIDTSDYTKYNNYSGVIESPLIRVGSSLKKKTLEHIEWSLAEPLVSGQNIRISYRLNNKDNYTVIKTWGFSTVGSVISFEDKALIANAELIQLKIELDQAESTLFGSNINLISVRLW